MQELSDQAQHPPAAAGPVFADQARFPTAADRYRALFTSIDEGYGLLELIYDDDGSAVDWRILEVNPAFERMTGLTDTVGRTARELNPVTEPSWAELLDTVARTGEARRFEHYAQGLDRWFEVYASRVGAAGSHLVAVVFNNVTARKRAEAAVRTSEEKFRAIIDQTSVGICHADLSGTLTFANHTFCTMLGYDDVEVIGTTIWELTHPDDLAENRHVFDELRTTGAPFELEKRLIRKDQSTLWATVSVAVLHDHDGQPHGTIAVVHDITARKQAEAAVTRALAVAQRAQVEAEAALKTREHFFATAAHELKTPLTSLMGYATLLQQAAARSTTDAAHMANKVVHQSQRLTTLIEQLLDISRLDQGQLAIERRPLDLAALAQEVVDEVRSTWPAPANHTVDLRIPAAPVLVDGDATRLEQVLHNLLNNAIKYSPHGGPIRVRVAPSTTEAVLEVTDAGIGIPAAEQAYLFDPLYRASNVGWQISGFGVGLHIVKEIVERHGGHIEVTSTERVGSTFRVVLPLAAAGAPAT